MIPEFHDVLLWARSSGLRLLLIVLLTILLVRLLGALTSRIARFTQSGSAPSELEKRARPLAGLLQTVGTAIIVVVALLRSRATCGGASSPASTASTSRPLTPIASC
jgi:hypothetical protein